jgi:AcrR family transcriptional regulator
MTKRQLQAIETKKRIHEGAIGIMSEQDYEKTTIAEICNAAGISMGHFYNYYKSKEELIEERFASFNEFVEEVFSDLKFDSPWDNLRALVYISAYKTKELGPQIMAQIFRVQLSVSNRLMTGDTAILHKTTKRLMQEAAAGEKLALSADKASDYLLREIRGLIFDWTMRDGKYDIIEHSLANLEIAIAFLQKGKVFPIDNPVYKRMKKLTAGF